MSPFRQKIRQFLTECRSTNSHCKRITLLVTREPVVSLVLLWNDAIPILYLKASWTNVFAGFHRHISPCDILQNRCTQCVLLLRNWSACLLLKKKPEMTVFQKWRPQWRWRWWGHLGSIQASEVTPKCHMKSTSCQCSLHWPYSTTFWLKSLKLHSITQILPSSLWIITEPISQMLQCCLFVCVCVCARARWRQRGTNMLRWNHQWWRLPDWVSGCTSCPHHTLSCHVIKRAVGDVQIRAEFPDNAPAQCA